MDGLTASVSSVSLVAIGAVALVALVFGIVDILRLPSWAWARAGQSRALSTALVIVIPIIGVIIYVFIIREPVASVAAKGRAASVPLEGVTAPRRPGQPGGRLQGTISPPVGFGSFGASPPMAPNPFGEASPPLDAVRRQQAVQAVQPVQADQPTERPVPAKPSDDRRPPAPEPTPVVPSGWKADPTGRHQFRYWDGFHWTENVADAGEQSRDTVTS